MSSAPPIRVTGVRGLVTKSLYGRGSRSERDAIFIETVKGRYILRRKSSSAFEDSKLEQYVGHHVLCDGFLVGTTLLAENIEGVD